MTKTKTIWIKNDVYKTLKQLSEEAGKSMTQIVDQATTDFIKKIR